MAKRVKCKRKGTIKPPKRHSSNENFLKKQLSSENLPLYVGMYDFSATGRSEMSFNKGDLLYIVNDEGDWWFARAKESGKEGYIPRNFVTEYKTLEAEEWFFGAIRLQDAKRKLLHSCNTCGAFLVHELKDTPGEYSLAVRNLQKVSHYRIRRKDDKLFIDQRVKFDSVKDLITYYSKPNDLMLVHLKRPCFKNELQYDVHSSSEAWEIDKSAIVFIKKLGGSQMGVVWQGVWNGITPVAVKMLRPGILGVPKFLEEVRLIKQLKHPKLAQIYAMRTKEEPIYVIMELTKHGSLLEYLRRAGLSLKFPQLMNMGAQIAAGMAYLEEKEYTHCNLAARNVLVCDGLICKVTDYAYGQFIYHEIQNDDFSIKWTAPEAALHNNFTIKSDVWSFGILLHELITYGSFPYPGMNNARVLELIQIGYRMPRPMGCPQELYKIMRDCWKDDPACRPTFETLNWQLEEFS